MYCPRCGQEQLTQETRFCSRCGFLLTGIALLVARDGELPDTADQSNAPIETERKRGLKHGALLIFAGIIIVPLTSIITVILDIDPYLPAISAILTFLGGFLRLIYALLFESGSRPAPANEKTVSGKAQHLINKNSIAGELPAARSTPVSAYVPPAAGTWRDTNDLNRAHSVTEETTRLLENERS